MENQTAVGDIEKTVPSEEIGKRGSNVSCKPHDSRVINVEGTDTEEEECVVEEVAGSNLSDVDDLLMEDGKNKEWLLKAKKMAGDEVIDVYLYCVVEKASGKITLMEIKELLIINPLCDETTYERASLRNWRASQLRWMLDVRSELATPGPMRKGGVAYCDKAPYASVNPTGSKTCPILSSF
ncbi:caspase-14-like [Platysternon megacephalum]|uniref:Caspase-14-like n=1 Tax=Platysternon megacephalum TaxID=55544 RepID=A0A4D9E209_9SAUR|nr:caspase-14-like [Platysternon megacephalum]